MSLSVEDLRKIIRSELAAAKPAETEPAVTHITSCPKCYRESLELMNSKSKFACKDCGLPLGDESFAQQIEECPNCGSKRAEEVRHE